MARASNAPPTSITPGTDVPGNGGVSNFTMVTPGAQGNPADYGYTAKAIANWNTPLFLEITAPTNIGVVSFKAPTNAEVAAGWRSNIAYVDFSCDGGPPLRVSSPAYNPDSGTEEFFFRLDPAAFTDGLHECQAVSVPTTGLAKALQGSKPNATGWVDKSFFFTTNANGSFVGAVRNVSLTGVNVAGCGVTGVTSPCATISYARDQINTAQSNDVGGGTICLGPSTTSNPHQWGAAVENFTRFAINRYLKISSCGLGKANVVVARLGGGNIRTEKIHVDDITLFGPGIDSGNTGTRNPVIWASNSDFVGPGVTVKNSQPLANGAFLGGIYFTSVTQSSMAGGRAGALLRNSVIHDIASDAMDNPRAVHNVTIYNQDGETYATGDTVSGSTTIANVSNYSRLFVGTAISNMCGITTSEQITAMNVGAGTITISSPCLQTLTATSIETGFHTDVMQYTVTTDNMTLFGITANDRINAEGLFAELSINLTNWALVNFTVDNQNYVPSNLVAFLLRSPNSGVHIENMNLVGPTNLVPGSFSATNFSVLNSSCANVPPDPLGPFAGVTYRNSPTCQ